MKTYGKVDTLFERDERFQVDTTRLRRPVFGTMSWLVTEKVDGTNIRIGFTAGDDRWAVAGKSDNASIPPNLLAHCDALGERAREHVSKTMADRGLQSYTLFGEGYGPKIQNGGRYRTDQGFVLFDVQINDGPFLSDGAVSDIADELGIPRVPFLNGAAPMGVVEIVDLVRGGFASDVADVFDPAFEAEGIVARPIEPLYDNRGERLMFKLKKRDFQPGKR